MRNHVSAPISYAVEQMRLLHVVGHAYAYGWIGALGVVGFVAFVRGEMEWPVGVVSTVSCAATLLAVSIPTLIWARAIVLIASRQSVRLADTELVISDHMLRKREIRLPYCAVGRIAVVRTGAEKEVRFDLEKEVLSQTREWQQRVSRHQQERGCDYAFPGAVIGDSRQIHEFVVELGKRTGAPVAEAEEPTVTVGPSRVMVFVATAFYSACAVVWLVRNP